MVAHQGPRRHAACKIVVHGMQDITSRLNPYLLSVQVISTTEGSSSKCNLELDDRDGQLQIPPDGVALFVSLGWAGEGPRVPDSGRYSTFGQGEMTMTEPERALEMKWGGPGLREVFSGQVSSVESGFGRKGGGRRLWIEATAANVKGMGKELQNQTWGEGKEKDDKPGVPIPFVQVATEVFAKIGVVVRVSPTMAARMAEHWSINNESPMAWGERIARELGGVFSLDNNIASFSGKFESTNAMGDTKPNVEAVWGVNLIGWRIKPFVGRPQYAQAASRYFDLHEGKWNVIMAAIPGDNVFFSGTEAIAHAVMPVADKAAADNLNTGTSATSQSKRGTGWVLLNGEPTAMGGSFVTIRGARDGVDGRYLISEAEHNYTRGVGFTTRCNVMYPTPYYGDETWTRDPGKYDPANPPANHTDPKAPGYTPPDEPKPGERQYTDAQKEVFRQWYRDNQKPFPKWLIPPDAQRR
jgi:hypothetical protein